MENAALGERRAEIFFCIVLIQMIVSYCHYMAFAILMQLVLFLWIIIRILFILHNKGQC
jgi:hypothetical protein